AAAEQNRHRCRGASQQQKAMTRGPHSVQRDRLDRWRRRSSALTRAFEALNNPRKWRLCALIVGSHPLLFLAVSSKKIWKARVQLQLCLYPQGLLFRQGF